MRAASEPSPPNANVYFEPSSGLTILSSPPRKRTSCHDLPATADVSVVCASAGPTNAMRYAAARYQLLSRRLMSLPPLRKIHRVMPRHAHVSHAGARDAHGISEILGPLI